MNEIPWGDLLQAFLLVSVTSLFLALLLGIWVWKRVRRLRLPPDVTFVEAMRLTPFPVVLLLDLLDFALDFFSTPISWAILSRLGLKQLRGATAIEALIPGTQVLPTMTVAWVLIRLFGPKLEEIPFAKKVINQQARKQLDEIPKRYRAPD